MKIKLLVLFGGKSTEHEISIISALQAIENLDKEKYDIYPVYISKNQEFYYDKEYLLNINNYKNLDLLFKKVKKVYLIRDNNFVYLKYVNNKLFTNNTISKIDILFPIVHGTNVEDGNLQGFLKTFDIPVCLSDCSSSALGMDKYLMKQILKSNNIPVLDVIKIDFNDFKNLDNTIKNIEQKLNYPMIVKPVNLGSSIGISKAENRDKLIECLNLAFSFSQTVIVEKAITNLREINCSVLGDKYEQRASALEEPFGKDEILSFNDKYLSGSKSKTSKVNIKNNINGTKSSGMASLQRKIPADVDKETESTIKKYAIDTFKAIGCSGVARIDLMIDKDTNNIYVNEINTIPGSLSYYLWDYEGITYKALLDKIIQIAIDNKRREDNLNFTFKSNVLS